MHCRTFRAVYDRPVPQRTNEMSVDPSNVVRSSIECRSTAIGNQTVSLYSENRSLDDSERRNATGRYQDGDVESVGRDFSFESRSGIVPIRSSFCRLLSGGPSQNIRGRSRESSIFGRGRVTSLVREGRRNLSRPASRAWFYRSTVDADPRIRRRVPSL